MIAKQDFKDLVAGQDYEVRGVWIDLAKIEYYQTVIGKKIVLYRPMRFDAEIIVDEDEF